MWSIAAASAALAIVIAAPAPALAAERDGIDGLPLERFDTPPETRGFAAVDARDRPLSGRWAVRVRRWTERSRVPMPDVPVRILAHDCGDDTGTLWSGGACALPPIRLVLLPPGFVERADLYHELGHIFDHWVLTATDRDRYRQMRGDRRGWDEWTVQQRADGSPITTEPYIGPPAEHFAESYAACAEHRRLPRAWVQETHGHGFATTPEDHIAVCTFIRQVYRRVTGQRFVPPRLHTTAP